MPEMPGNSEIAVRGLTWWQHHHNSPTLHEGGKERSKLKTRTLAGAVSWSIAIAKVGRSAAGAVALLLLLPFYVGTVAAAPARDAADVFYDSKAIQTIHLEVKPEDLDRLHRGLPERIVVPGTFRWNDQRLVDVGVRYKGNSSSGPNSEHKRGFVIAFSEFKTRQRFLGLRHVALDNGIKFGSLFSLRLITDTLRDLGVKASRCNYARVYLNEKYIGVYLNVERIDMSFIERHFGTGKGTLFKVSQGGPGADFRYLGADPALYRKTFELHSGSEVEAYAQLVQFIHSIDTPKGTEAELRRSLDVEAFLKTVAVMLFAGAFDQYTGWGPHNYYLYRNPADQRWTYIPWDLDVGFADKAFDRVPVLDGWNAAWPDPIPGRPLMERIVSDPVLLKTYREQANLILEGSFRPEILIPKLRSLYEQIRPALEADPFPDRRATVPSDTGYKGIISSMEAFIKKRYVLARAQLDAPGNRPQPHPMPPESNQEGPKPGPASADAPSDLHVLKVTPGSVELRWTDHVQGEIAYVVQRCTGPECIDFANVIGQGGQAITTAVDRNVQPGMTYRYRVYAVLQTPQGPRGTGVSDVITVIIPKSQ
jgi:spore coat protein CotH